MKILRDRLARFEREAKTLASLNHQNIAIVHGLEKADGIRALVMELVEGPTLADRIASVGPDITRASASTPPKPIGGQVDDEFPTTDRSI